MVQSHDDDEHDDGNDAVDALTKVEDYCDNYHDDDNGDDVLEDALTKDYDDDDVDVVAVEVDALAKVEDLIQ